MIKVGLPKGRMARQSQKIGSALGAEIQTPALRYKIELDACSVGIYLLKAPDIARLVLQRRLVMPGSAGVVGFSGVGLADASPV